MAESLTTLPSRSPIAIMPVWTRTLANELAASCDGVQLRLDPEEPWTSSGDTPLTLRSMPTARRAALLGTVDWAGPMQDVLDAPIPVVTLPPELSPDRQRLGWTSTLHPTASAVVRWDVKPADDPQQGATVSIQRMGASWPVAHLLSARLLVSSISWELR